MTNLLELFNELEEMVPTVPEPIPEVFERPRRIPFSCRRWKYQDSVASYFKCFIRDDWLPTENCSQDDWEWYLGLICLLDEETDVQKVIFILYDHGLQSDELLDYCLKALKDYYE